MIRRPTYAEQAITLYAEAVYRMADILEDTAWDTHGVEARLERLNKILDALNTALAKHPSTPSQG